MGVEGVGFSTEHCSFLIASQKKYMLWYSLEAPQRVISNEYLQHMFSLRNKKIFSVLPPAVLA